MLHVILTYIDDCDTTGVDIFRTKEDAMEYVLDSIRRDWEDYRGIKDDADRRKMEEEMAEAKARLDEKGWWKDHDGNTFTYEEKDFAK